MFKLLILFAIFYSSFVASGHPLMRLANTALASLSTIPLEMPSPIDQLPCETDVDCRRTFHDPMTFCYESFCIRH